MRLVRSQKPLEPFHWIQNAGKLCRGGNSHNTTPITLKMKKKKEKLLGVNLKIIDYKICPKSNLNMKK